MKNGFSVIARFLVCFLGIEVIATLVLAAGPLLDSVAENRSFDLSYWLGYALESLPVSVAVAVYYSGFAATRKLRNRLSGYLILFLLSASILSGGVVLSNGISPPPEPFPARSLASSPSNQPSRYFNREASGTSISGIVYVRDGDTTPRLAWASSGTLIPEKSVLLVKGNTLPAPGEAGSKPTSPLPGFAEMRTWYLGLGRENLFWALAAAAGTAALICGLWPLSRLFRWPLIGTFASGAALLSLGYLNRAFHSPSVQDLAALIGLKVPMPLLIGILSGACGMALAFLDFALCPSPGASGRRKRGQP